MAEPSPSTKKLGGNVIALSVASFLTDVSSEMAYVILPMFLTSSLGVTISFLGIVEGAAETVSSFMKYVSGRLSDRYKNRKRLVVLGYTLSGLTRPLMALATAGFHVLATRVLDRIGKGIRTSPRDALLAASSHPENKGRVFGFHRSMDHLGAIVGSLIASALLAAGIFSFRQIFWFSAIPMVLTVFTLVVFVREKMKTVLLLEQNQSKTAKEVVSNPQFRKFLIFFFLFTLGNSSDAFLIIRARDLGVAEATIPMLWALLHVIKVVTVFPLGGLSDRVGRKKMVLSGWLFYATIYVGFAFAQQPIHAWILFACYGIFYGLTEGAEKAWVAEFVNPHQLGRAYGAFALAVSIGALPASLITGMLWQYINPTAAFLFGALMAFIAAIGLWQFVPNRKSI